MFGSKSPYPLLSLKYRGLLCPCLERADDRPARKAAWAMNSICIRWHRRLRRGNGNNDDGDSSSSSGGGGIMGGFLSSMLGGDNSHSHRDCYYEPLDNATLSVVDSSSGPQLVVSSPHSSLLSNNTATSSISKKCIPLTAIKKVQIVPPPNKKGGGAGGGAGAGAGSIEVVDIANRTILRFDVLKSQQRIWNDEHDDDNDDDEEAGGQGGQMVVEDANESTRDTILDHIHTLVEWERRRRAYIAMLGEEEGEENADGNDGLEDEMNVEEYDDGNMPTSPRTARKKGMIAEQAQKIKHFAQRELELQKLKKERENRKAKYVKEAGGLKYTAIAMANRS